MKETIGTTNNRIGKTVQESEAETTLVMLPSDANPLGNRLLELQKMLQLAQEQQLKIATIDLRYGLHPVYTLK